MMVVEMEDREGCLRVCGDRVVVEEEEGCAGGDGNYAGG